MFVAFLCVEGEKVSNFFVLPRRVNVTQPKTVKPGADMIPILKPIDASATDAIKDDCIIYSPNLPEDTMFVFAGASAGPDSRAIS